MLFSGLRFPVRSSALILSPPAGVGRAKVDIGVPPVRHCSNIGKVFDT
jgi:hypothetical protein